MMKSRQASLGTREQVCLCTVHLVQSSVGRTAVVLYQWRQTHIKPASTPASHACFIKLPSFPRVLELVYRGTKSQSIPIHQPSKTGAAQAKQSPATPRGVCSACGFHYTVAFSGPGRCPYHRMTAFNSCLLSFHVTLPLHCPLATRELPLEEDRTLPQRTNT